MTVASVELADPQKAAGDKLALGLGDVRPVHGPSEGAERVHALAGLLPQELREGSANLGQFLCKLARRPVDVLSDVGRALSEDLSCTLSELDALASNIGARLGSRARDPCQLLVVALGNGAVLLALAFEMGDLGHGCILGSGEGTSRQLS